MIIETQPQRSLSKEYLQVLRANWKWATALIFLALTGVGAHEGRPYVSMPGPQGLENLLTGQQNWVDAVEVPDDDPNCVTHDVFINHDQAHPVTADLEVIGNGKRISQKASGKAGMTSVRFVTCYVSKGAQLENPHVTISSINADGVEVGPVALGEADLDN